MPARAELKWQFLESEALGIGGQQIKENLKPLAGELTNRKMEDLSFEHEEAAHGIAIRI